MSKYNLHNLLSEMTNDEFRAAEEADRLEAHPESNKIKAIMALMAKEKNKKIDPKSAAVDKDGNIEDELPGEMAEARIDRDVAERIEGLLDISMKAKFIDAFMDIYEDLLEEDNFYPEDIVNHLNNEMHAELAGYQRQGDKLAGIGEVLGVKSDDGTEDNVDNIDKVASPGAKAKDYDSAIGAERSEDSQESSDITQTTKPMYTENGEIDEYTNELDEASDKMMSVAAKMIKDRILKDIPMDIIMDFVKTHSEDIKGMTNSEIKDEFEEFRSVNYDYIDEDLKKHFNRFK